MFCSTHISFRHGELLSLEMLETLQNQALSDRTFYQTYSDGILNGLTFRKDKVSGHILMDGGSVKWQGEIYTCTQSADITELMEQEQQRMPPQHDPNYYLVLRKTEREISEGVTEKGLTLCPLPAADRTEDDIILAAFSFNATRSEWFVEADNANPVTELEYQAQKFPYQFNFCDMPYSLPQGRSGFSPYIGTLILKILEKKPKLSDNDFLLRLLLVQNPVIATETLRLWAERVGGTTIKDDRHEILKKVKECLEKKVTSYSPPPSQTPAPAAPKTGGRLTPKTF